jgi:uncharacterized protein YraI
MKMKSNTLAALVGLGLSVVGISAASAAPATVVADINMRRGPGTNFGVVAVIPEGVTVDRGRCASNNWCRVSWNGRSGFIKGSYMVAGQRGGRVVRQRVYEEPEETIYVERAPRVVVTPPIFGYGYEQPAPYYYGGQRYVRPNYAPQNYGYRGGPQRNYGYQNQDNQNYGNQRRYDQNPAYYGNRPARASRGPDYVRGGTVPLGQPANPNSGQGITYGPGGASYGSGSGAPGVEPNPIATAR